MPSIAQVVKGEDRILTLSVKVGNREGDPYDLTGWTKISVEFRKNDNSILVKDTVPTDGIFATGTHTNNIDTVIFTADQIGIVGNAISLVFNGTDDLDTVVSTWNASNAGNTVSHDGVGTLVLPAATINLAGGINDVQYVNILGSVLLGKIQVEITDIDTSSLRMGKSQSVRVKIDKNEVRRIAVFRNAIDIINPQF